MVDPMSQWFGSGLGHIGSTWNIGASTAALLCATVVFSIIRWAPPRAARIEHNAVAMNTVLNRFMVAPDLRIQASTGLGTLASGRSEQTEIIRNGRLEVT